MNHNFNVHGAPAFDPSKAAILGPSTLGAPKIPAFAAVDLVEEQALRSDGPTWFTRLDGMASKGDSGWLALVDRKGGYSFIGATVLRPVQVGNQVAIWPVVGARVVLRLAGEGEGVVLMDCMTAASGQTIPLTHFAVWIEHGRIRLEVTAPGCEGKLARVALHAVVERGT